MTATAEAPPVAIVEVYDSHRRLQTQHRLVGDRAVCKIGRAVHCDIVLDDAYAAPEHAVLTLESDGRLLVTDLNSHNGTRVGEHRLIGSSMTVDAETLIVGRTRIRVRTARAPLPAEKVFRRDVIQRFRTPLAVLGLTLLLAFVAFNEWRQAPDQLARDAVLAILLAAGILTAWIGLWALITRVSHGDWALRLHIAVAANAAAIVLWSSWVFALAAFVTGWSWLTVPFVLLAATTLLGALYVHLRKATHLSVRLAASVAVALPLALATTTLWLSSDADSRNVNRLTLGNAVFPPALRLETATELDEYLATLPDLKRKANRSRQRSLADNPPATE